MERGAPLILLVLFALLIALFLGFREYFGWWDHRPKPATPPLSPAPPLREAAPARPGPAQPVQTTIAAPRPIPVPASPPPEPPASPQ